LHASTIPQCLDSSQVSHSVFFRIFFRSRLSWVAELFNTPLQQTPTLHRPPVRWTLTRTARSPPRLDLTRALGSFLERNLKEPFSEPPHLFDTLFRSFVVFLRLSSDPHPQFCFSRSILLPFSFLNRVGFDLFRKQNHPLAAKEDSKGGHVSCLWVITSDGVFHPPPPEPTLPPLSPG